MPGVRKFNMKLAIFGASGRTGQHLVEQACAAGYEVTAYVRNPARFSLQHPDLKVVQGDIQDPVRVEQALSGSQAVISVLGPASNQPVFEVSRGMEHILAAMQRQGVRRLVVTIGAGVSDPQDELRPFNHLMNALVKRLSRWVYEDMKRVADLVRASDRDWVIVRVPMLTDEPRRGSLKIGWVGKGVGARLSRADLAAFMLRQVQEDTYLHRAPAISN